MADKTVLSLVGIERHYGQGDTLLTILKDANFTLKAGETVALVAPSGTGKSTLLHLAGLLEHPDAGEVTIGGVACNGLPDDHRTAIRRKSVGFVYQFHHLLPEFTALENIMMPQLIAGLPMAEAKERARQLLDYMRVGHRADHRPSELSGGEQQRVAIAVALANRPALLLADEPTGELDSSTAATIFDIFHNLNRQFGLTVVIVSHDPQIARYVGRVVAIRDGKTSTETIRRQSEQTETDKQSEQVFDELLMLDSAGRLQVPKELRERYGIGDRVQIEETSEGLLIRAVAGGERVRQLVTSDAPPPKRPGLLGRLLGSVRRGE